MCGICGSVGFDERGAAVETLQPMLAQLAQRGPDHEGRWTDGTVALGHRRLSIIDLSPAGNQPMVDEKRQLVVTYNGEIYNYRELRRDLEGRGYRFASSSDTEVLLKAYDAWGDDFVKRLYGMFAFCLYDRKRGRVVLGRDRLGIKPLYYVHTPERLVFASTLPALVAAGVVDFDLSPEALHHYLTFHAVVPAPRTLFRNVHKLEPATLLVVERDGRTTKRRYWDVAFERGPAQSEEEWIERLLDTLRTAVKRRLVSDVPVGALLSGGVDSSLIVALMAEVASGPLRTYTIGFDDVAGEEGNEFRYSNQIVERFGTEHRNIYVTQRELLDHLVPCIAAMSEPMVSHDCVAFYLLSREVSKETKVVLSGQGADEVFAGYHWYPKIHAGTGDPVERYRRAFFDRDDAEVREALDPAYHADGDVSLAYVRDHFARPGADEAVNRALRLDTTVMLVDDPVKRVDNMTMAWGLEARVPFLDHDLVELAAQIPPTLKLTRGGKGILKRAAERLIPREVIYRKKGYFPVPALKYLRGPFLAFAHDVLTSSRARSRALFRRAYVDRLLADPEQHLTVLGGSKLWQLTVLECWLQQMEAIRNGQPSGSVSRAAQTV